ncbi:MAG: MlaD family protein [Myxococcota bacterium]|nr:MlaD family protein [Myxococcota bacterium]
MTGRKRQNELKVGGLLLLAVAVFAWLSIQIGAFQGFGDTLEVTVTFDDAAGLVADSSVKVAGVEVGRVESLGIRFDEAVAVLSLQADAQIRNDVQAQVRSRSLLGEKYVQLQPRSPDAPLLKDGDVIENTVPSVEIDDLVATIGPLLSEVSAEDVASLVSSLAGLAGNLDDESKGLISSTRTLLERLNVAAEVAPAIKEEVPPLLKDMRRTVREARSTIKEADQAIRRAEEVLGEVDRSAGEVPALLADLQKAIDTLEPGLDDLKRAMEGSDAVVKSVDKVLGNWEDFNEADLRRLLREEGVLVRLKEPRKKKE